MKVLLVEDDRRIAEPLIDGLRSQGHSVKWVTRGADAVTDDGDGLASLDLGLPDIDGTDVCRALRAADVGRPIIVITARGEEEDRVQGPRRSAPTTTSSSPSASASSPPGCAPWPADAAETTDAAGAGRPGEGAAGRPLARAARRRPGGRTGCASTAPRWLLTPKEFQLLAVLAEAPGQVVNRQVVVRCRVGPALLRHNEDARRARGVAAPQARAPRVDRDDPQRRAPTGPHHLTVRRRLVLAYLALAALRPIALEVPLGLLAASHERDAVRASARQDAAILAALAGPALHADGSDRGPDLDDLTSHYAIETGAEVTIVDRNGKTVAYQPSADEQDRPTPRATTAPRCGSPPRVGRRWSAAATRAGRWRSWPSR